MAKPPAGEGKKPDRPDTKSDRPDERPSDGPGVRGEIPPPARLQEVYPGSSARAGRYCDRNPEREAAHMEATADHRAKKPRKPKVERTRSAEDEAPDGVRFVVLLTDADECGEAIRMLPRAELKRRVTGEYRFGAGFLARDDAERAAKARAPKGYRFTVVDLTDAEIAKRKRLDSIKPIRVAS
jgi:hypothetical protein